MESSIDNIILARGLTKSFGDATVVRGIDFEVGRGRCFGFLGPNGAGKTTTLRMILGLSPITAGVLEVLGGPIAKRASQVRQRIGVVPQIDNLDPDFTVTENLRIYGSFFQLPERDLRERIPGLLDFVALSDRADDKIDTLSGGMKRRLTIARALINDPELVVLDEPTTGLDPQVRHLIWARLQDLVKEGKTLLLTSHYMEEAERLCDELVIMDQGEILERGEPTKLIGAHVAAEVLEVRSRTEQAAALLGDLPDINLEQVGATLYAYGTTIRPAVEVLERAGDFVLLHRPATLEDVFLKLTGRDLRE